MDGFIKERLVSEGVYLEGQQSRGDSGAEQSAELRLMFRRTRSIRFAVNGPIQLQVDSFENRKSADRFRALASVGSPVPNHESRALVPRRWRLKPELVCPGPDSDPAPRPKPGRAGAAVFQFAGLEKCL